MRQRILSSPFAPLLALLALASSAARPILPTLPCSDDAAFHLLRLTQLDALIERGILYSRWAPNMANGYGFPIFNFYAPLSYYAAWIISLPVGDLHLGLRLTFAVGVFLAGATMYLLAREFLSRPGAFVAAAAYIFAPYHGYDIYFRGNLAESFAWWLLPLTLWAFWRVAKTRSWRWVAIASICYAAVLLTHNVFALIFSPVLALWALFGAWQAQGTHRGMPQQVQVPVGAQGQAQRLALTIAPILLGLGLSIFFWLPALTERALIHTEWLLVPPVFVYWGNFITLSELFAGPIPVTPDLINPSIPRTLGLIGVLIALPSLGFLFKPSKLRPLIALTWLGLLIMSFFMLAPSDFFWRTLPLIEFIQFPWRLLGVAALLLALLCGASVEWLSGRAQTWVAVGAIALLGLSSLYWFNPRYCTGLENPTVADIVAFEQGSNTIGTTAKGEYLPRTADFVPAETATEPFQMPEGVTLLEQESNGVRFTGQFEAESATTLVVNAFDYPGWRAEVNGKKVDIIPRSGDGLITLELPAGESTVEVVFGETPSRRLMNWLSALTAILVVGLLFIPHRPESLLRQPPADRSLEPIFVTGLGLLIVTAWLLPNIPTPLWRDRLPALETAGPAAAYQNGFVLLDYQIASRTMAADEQLDINLKWRATQPLAADLQARVELIDADGRSWSDAETRWPRIYRPYYPTLDWPTDQFADEMMLATGISGMPPGTYTLNLVVFDKATLQPVPLNDGATGLALGTVEVTRPGEPFAADGRFTPEDGQFDDIALLTYEPDRAEANVGDPFTFTAFWEASVSPKNDYQTVLMLIDPAGEIAWEQVFPVVSRALPTTAWQGDDVWRGRYIDRIPASLPSGIYRWGLCLNGGEEPCESNLLELTEIEITAPERTFTAPEVAIDIDESLGSVATLVGANTRPCSDRQEFTCDVDLLWRAEKEVGLSYIVFVQMLNADGQVVAQSDAEPAAWSRPTTSWVAGEFIVDPHRLNIPSDLPAGDYTIQVGMYLPNGLRLLTPLGQDSILISE